MDTESAIKFLRSITDISDDFIRDINEGMQPEHYKMHQILIAEGQIENRIWFLQSGLVRSYFYDKEGVEHTLRFWAGGEIIFSYAGFWKQPSTEYLEVLEESTLISCTYEHLDLLKINHKETPLIISTIARRFHLQEYKRERLYSQSAIERYLQLRKENPSLFTKAPIRIIASYLHMTRETLTRLIAQR